LVVQIVESKKFDGRGYQNAILVGYPLGGLFSNVQTTPMQSTEFVRTVESEKVGGRGYQIGFLTGYPLGGLFTSGENRTKAKGIGCANRRK
jgi:hypothetical protein